jgi:two-component system OmpR family sensor kinase
MISLRKVALIWTTILLTIVATAVVVASRHVAIVEVNKLLDNELQQIAINAGHGLKEDALEPLLETETENRVSVQIWSRTGEIIHESKMTDKLPRQKELGFSDVEVSGYPWRVFTTSDGQLFAQIGQRWSARLEIANHAAVAAAVPLLAAFPIAWIAVILGLDQLLQRLSGFSNALANRSVDAKDPIILGEMPDEFVPTISAINSLIDRHRLAVEQQKQFVSEAAHELRTPLAALQIQIDNLGNRPDVEVQREISKELSGGVRRASAMVGQLLKMARLDDPLVSYREADLDLKELIVSVVSDFVLTSARGGVELSMTIDETPTIRGSDAEIRLLFANLIDNAIRYTPYGGNVEVFIKQADLGVSVEIVDSGIGIPDGALPRIFDRFYRAAPSDIEGTGLGLAIARKIAERNKFQLVIVNRKDHKGVVAQVLIPETA